jgi:hypothetical protein
MARAVNRRMAQEDTGDELVTRRAFRHAVTRASVIATAMLCAVPAGAGAHPAAHARRRSGCRVPRLTALTLDVALHRALHAGCRLRVKGAHVRQPGIQTVRRQSPAGGTRAAGVTVWVNPLCTGSVAPGPPAGEPILTPGPTELVSGFFIQGGPIRIFSSPGCSSPQASPGAGTVEVIDPSTGAVVASQSSASGQFATIPLPAGSYTIVGTFPNAILNGEHAMQTLSVSIPPGYSVRQDFTLAVP